MNLNPFLAALGGAFRGAAVDQEMQRRLQAADEERQRIARAEARQAVLDQRQLDQDQYARKHSDFMASLAADREGYVPMEAMKSDSIAASLPTGPLGMPDNLARLVELAKTKATGRFRTLPSGDVLGYDPQADPKVQDRQRAEAVAKLQAEREDRRFAEQAKLRATERAEDAKQSEKEIRLRASLQSAQDKLVPVQTEKGDVIYVPSSQAAGRIVGKAGGAGGALSGITMQTMGRMGTSYNDLAQTIAEMEKMENDPIFRAKLTAWNKSKMAAAETHPNADAHGFGGVFNNALGQFAAGQAQSALDPDLNTYMNLKQRVGTAFTELLPRPNQQLLQIEKGLSGIDVGWNPQLMAGIQARRRGGLEVLQNILSQRGMLDENGHIKTGASATSSTAAPAMTFEQWLASKAKRM